MISDNIQGLDTLEAWKKSTGFALKVYQEILPLLLQEEKWNLNQQIRRSASSIPANIVEGHGRFSCQENIRFCDVARGSLTETYSHITFSHELGYIPVEKYTDIKKLIDELVRIINGYISYLKRSKIGANEPGANYNLREQSVLYSIESSGGSEAIDRP